MLLSSLLNFTSSHRDWASRCFLLPGTWKQLDPRLVKQRSCRPLCFWLVFLSPCTFWSTAVMAMAIGVISTQEHHKHSLTHTPSLFLSLYEVDRRRCEERCEESFYNLSWHTNFQQQTGRPPSGFQGSFFGGKENNKKAKPRSLSCSLSLCCKQLNEPTLDAWNPSKCVWGRIIVSREEKQTHPVFIFICLFFFFSLCLAKNNKQASTANSVAHLSPSFSLCKVVQERNIGSRSKKKIGKGICTSQVRKKSWSYIAFSRFARPHLIPHFK